MVRMASFEQTPDILTPEQVARYLQVNRETVYLNIRQGLLDASRLGRSYRIPRRSVDLLLSATRARPYVQLREYTAAQLDQFVRDDVLDERTRTVTRHFDRVMDEADAQPAKEAREAKARP
jgi:excisionase family DNA binding protein